jgi:hypothetical protein
MGAVMNSLSRLALVIGLPIVLVATPAYTASFLIELTNGRDVRASHVWEEGDEIKFSTADGTAGVPKHLVKRIQPSTTVDQDTASATALPPGPADRALSTTDRRSAKSPQQDGGMRRAAGTGPSSADQPPDGSTRLKAGEAQAYQAKKVMLTSQLDAATTKYLEASAARNPDAKQAALAEMREHSKTILALEDEVKKRNGGVLPPWWNG